MPMYSIVIVSSSDLDRTKCNEVFMKYMLLREYNLNVEKMLTFLVITAEQVHIWWRHLIANEFRTVKQLKSKKNDID